MLACACTCPISQQRIGYYFGILCLRWLPLASERLPRRWCRRIQDSGLVCSSDCEIGVASELCSQTAKIDRLYCIQKSAALVWVSPFPTCHILLVHLLIRSEQLSAQRTSESSNEMTTSSLKIGLGSGCRFLLFDRRSCFLTVMGLLLGSFRLHLAARIVVQCVQLVHIWATVGYTLLQAALMASNSDISGPSLGGDFHSYMRSCSIQKLLPWLYHELLESLWPSQLLMC